MTLVIALMCALLLPARADAEPVASPSGLTPIQTTDPSSIDGWEGIISYSTENIGRIWTDKSVFSDEIVTLPGGNTPSVSKGSSDFLVALSALSSTSNITTTQAKPLDIVLVLDTSGSMGNSIGSTTYIATYDIDTGDDYYVNVNGSYTRVSYTNGSLLGGSGWYYGSWPNRVYVTPKSSADDADTSHVQFYSSISTKMDALQHAASNFARATAENNEGLDAGMQSRISLITYSSQANVVSHLQAYTPETVNDVVQSIEGLRSNGATAADYAMTSAATELSSARSDAQKVVIFFTDGEPNHNNGFNGDVANAAIATAATMKAQGALVYSVGVFEDADPSNTTISDDNRFNTYMHAMSSNYPSASSYSVLGQRAQNSNYYKAAADADELSAIFDEISDEISSGTGYPTTVTEGAENTSGYVAFVDELGAYMHVDEFRDIVFADETFSVVDTNTEGTITTYSYEGVAGNTLYPQGNLSSIIVRVERFADPSRGDRVVVMIPASLIPLRSFDVDTDTLDMSIIEAFPLRVFYGVSLDSSVYDALALGTADEALEAYVAEHSENGSARFYTNYYNGEHVIPSTGQVLGNTTSSFRPAKSNAFYYFTKDTPLFLDEECTQPVTDETPIPGAYYYYKSSYYEQQGSKAVVKEKTVPVHQGDLARVDTIVGYNDDGQAYIKAGSPRLTTIYLTSAEKTSNATSTATEVISPQWDSEETPDILNVYLGNNATLDVPIPGTLVIKKDARVADGKNIDEDAVMQAASFTFEVRIPSAAGTTRTAEVLDASGVVVAGSFDMTFDDNGVARQTIADGQSVVIHGIEEGATYEVVEATMPAGFTLTSVNGSADAQSATGTIASGQTHTATFVDTYDVSSVTVPADEFARYQKTFDRWDLVSSFEVTLAADDAGSSSVFPMPAGSFEGRISATVSQQAAEGSFGDVTFDKVGVYGYTVHEATPVSPLPGVTYSSASYSITVTVSDNGEGALEADIAMIKTAQDSGADIDPGESVSDMTARFVNTFDARGVMSGPQATKNYIDKGGRALVDGMFTFKVRAIGDTADTAPLPVQPDATGYAYVKNRGSSVNFGQALFDDSLVGHEYVYEISEVIPDGATNAQFPGVSYASASEDQRATAGWTYAGVEYDSAVYHATFAVTSTQDAVGDPVVAVAVSYAYADGSSLTGAIPQFTNIYDPEDAVLSGPTALSGVKTLTGRDGAEGEAFSFVLFAADDSTRAALASDAVVLAEDEGAETMRASTSGRLEDGVAESFSFGSVRFSLPGVYRFLVEEEAPSADGEGMTYDRRQVPVTVTVADGDSDGALEASVAYGAGAGGATSAAAFENVYRASGSFAADAQLVVTKTLAGRDLRAEEFGFSVRGADAPGSVPAAESDALLAESDRSFSNTMTAEAGRTVSMPVGMRGLTFGQGQAGKVYSFLVSEALPADDDPEAPGVQSEGVTYDETAYRLDIAVVDDGRGAVHTRTTVTRMEGGASEAAGVYDGADGRDTITLPFENSYAAKPVTFDTGAQAPLRKVLDGRDWTDADAFTFRLSAASPEAAPLPERTVVTLAAPDALSGEEVAFGFGAIEFDTPGTYVYKVVEDKAGTLEAGIRYASNAATMTVTVSDAGDGSLAASATVASGEFRNVYSATLDHEDAGGIVVTKVLYGHDMAYRQFEFMVEALGSDTASAEEAAERIGLPEGQLSATFGNFAGASGQVVEMPSTSPVVFTLDDVGKTYRFRFSERGADGAFGSGGTAAGYTYSDAVYTVDLSVADAGDGTLSLKTVVADGKGGTTEQVSSAADPYTTYVPFANSYEASTDAPGGVRASVATTKVLTGRPLQEGEFRFSLVPRAASAAAVLTAANEADGTVDFGELSYTDADLDAAVAAGYAAKRIDPQTGNATWTVSYTALEETGDLPAGVTAVKDSFDLTVVVTDLGDGALEAAVELPQDHGFVNAYATDGSVSKQLMGSKILSANEGLSPASIEGKFTFTVTAEQGAPLPQRTSATNDAQGNVDFGTIEFTLDDLNAKLAGDTTSGDVRTATFAYTIEESGDVAGVTNDATPKTVTFTVTDDGQGNLAVSCDPVAGPLFTFVNTYGTTNIPSSITDQISITKVLSGRDLREGEFTFELVENGKVVSRGTNDAAGTVVFAPVTYTRPAEHTYLVREAASDAAAGITYDERTYTVLTSVKDSGDGTLSVAHSTQGDAIVFENSYEPSSAEVSIGVSKRLVGADLAAGQFAFELRDAADTRLAVAKNDATGSVAFEPVTFEASDMKDAALDPKTGLPTKVFSYTVSEVDDGQEHVAYDGRKIVVRVTVADDLSGKLVVSDVSYSEEPVFKNVYEVPTQPEDPTPPADEDGDEGKGSGIPAKTGDAMAPVVGGIATIALLAVVFIVIAAVKRRQG